MTHEIRPWERELAKRWMGIEDGVIEKEKRDRLRSFSKWTDLKYCHQPFYDECKRRKEQEEAKR